ncbi:DUF4240 domain-containing protein [Nonomuraea cavernae]|uniref:DUF4240 domain-containing protein n=1 Tax=Nonomuraea cavernae TaxID=2045107 RepID=UPI0033D40250
MDIDGFWDLIERSDRETDTRETRLAWLEDELARRSVEEVVDYYAWWKITQGRGCTTDLYAAYWFVFGMGSLDGFEYFVDWLISLGRATFEDVADCPDCLIELPEVLRLLERKRLYYSAKIKRRRPAWTEEEYPEFELLGYVAYSAYERFGREVDGLHAAVQARDIDSGFPLIPAIEETRQGEKWDLEDDREVLRRLPRIARYLGL